MENVLLGDLVLLTPTDPAVAAGALGVRNALEPLVVAEAARHREADDVRDLVRLAAALDARRDEPAAFLQANWALHRRLARLVRNPVLADVYRATLDVAEARVAGVAATDEFRRSAAQTVAVHHELVAAIGAGDEDEAAEAAARHAPAVARVRAVDGA